MTVICDVRNNAMYNLVVIEFPDGSLSGFLGGMIGVREAGSPDDISAANSIEY